MAGKLQTRETSAPSTWYRRGPLKSLREEMEELFSDFINVGENWTSGRIAPSLDLVESDTAIEVRLDLPAVKSQDIEIQLSGNTLTVSGERSEEKEEKGRTFHRVERQSGRFARSVTLPCRVKEDKVEAKYRDGVLTVNLPKTEESKTRKIPVKS